MKLKSKRSIKITILGSVQFKFQTCTNGTKSTDQTLSESNLTMVMAATKANSQSIALEPTSYKLKSMVSMLLIALGQLC